MNLSVQTASSSSSSSTAHGTHETCSMSVIHNVSFAPWMCLSSLPNNGFLLKISRSSLSGRVLTLKHLQQVANSPKQHWLYWLWWCRWCWARSYGTSPQHPAQYVLSCSDVSRGPANHRLGWAPCCGLSNQSAGTQVAFVRRVWVRWCDRGSADGPALNEQMWLQVSLFIHLRSIMLLKIWLWYKKKHL